MKAILALEDGTIYTGQSIGAEGEVAGEIVFTTSMSGYQEQITDPSYKGQIIAFTYPLIGNYGVNPDDVESLRPACNGVIIKDLCDTPSNFRCEGTLDDYLKRYGLVGICDIDTRSLTKRLREKGTMLGMISTDPAFDFAKKRAAILGSKVSHPVPEVTSFEITEYAPTAEPNGLTVVNIDYGVKLNMIRCLQALGCRVVRVPASTDFRTIKSFRPDGILLSNGPGDPKDCKKYLPVLKKIIEHKIPMFGICIGHQLIALANGFNTVPLKFGHRGANHPVKDLDTGVVYATSQNHGYTVDPAAVDPAIARITHINMHDNSVEGIEYKNAPVFTVQFHPEASPGPHDSAPLFEKFIRLMREHKKV